MTAKQVAAEIEHAKQVTPLPPGAAWRSITLDPNGSYGPYSGGSMIEWQAMCAWFAETEAAAAAGDEQRLARADAVTATIPSWRAFADPALLDDNGRVLIHQMTAAAAARAFATMASFMAGNCRR